MRIRQIRWIVRQKAGGLVHFEPEAVLFSLLTVVMFRPARDPEAAPALAYKHNSENFLNLVALIFVLSPQKKAKRQQPAPAIQHRVFMLRQN